MPCQTFPVLVMDRCRVVNPIDLAGCKREYSGSIETIDFQISSSYRHFQSKLLRSFSKFCSKYSLSEDAYRHLW